MDIPNVSLSSYRFQLDSQTGFSHLFKDEEIVGYYTMMASPFKNQGYNLYFFGEFTPTDDCFMGVTMRQVIELLLQTALAHYGGGGLSPIKNY